MTDFEFSPMSFAPQLLTISIPNKENDSAFNLFEHEPTFTDLLDPDNMEVLNLFVSPTGTPSGIVDHQQLHAMMLERTESPSVDTSNTFETAPHAVTNNTDRIWKTVASKIELESLNIKLKTRRDAPSEIVPDKMYSSLKYEVHLTAVGSAIKQLPFLLARASVVDSQNLEKISLPSSKGAVLKGDIEASMSKVPNGPANLVKGMLKIQLNSDLSYHHEKRLLCLVVEFFEPDSLESPVIIARSASLKCYARKPNKKYPKKKQAPTATEVSSKKRKKAPTSSKVMDSPAAKKSKIENEVPVVVPSAQRTESDAFTDFKKRLDDLMDVNASMQEDVRTMCMNYLFEKFVLSDPAMARKVLMPALVNPFAMIAPQQSDLFPPVQPISNGPVLNDHEFEQDLLEFADEFLM
jgi:hypothetical protein